MADKTQKTEQTVPVPIQLALEALKILEAEGGAAEGLKKSLPAFAMQLAKAGEEVTVDILLARVRAGDTAPEKATEQKAKTYAEVVATLPAPQKSERDKFIDAVRARDLETVRLLVDQGEDPHIGDEWALATVAYYGRLDMVKYFVEEQGADINAGTGKALAQAASSGQMEIVKYLAEKNCADLKSGFALQIALEYAACWGYLDIVKYLVESQDTTVDIKNNTLQWAAAKGQLGIVKYLGEEQGADVHAGHEKALQRAAVSGRLDVVKYLVEEKGAALLTSEGTDALEEAARGGHLDVVKYFLEIDDSSKQLALNGAAGCGALEVLKYLVEEKGVDPHANEEVALRHAAGLGRLNIVKYLVEERGADIYAGDKNALKKAADSNHFETMKYLFEERQADTAVLTQQQVEHLENARKSQALWKKVMRIDPPYGLLDKNPAYFRTKAFKAVLEMLQQENAYIDDAVSNRVAFAVSGLFGTEERVLKYLEKCGQQGKTPLYDVVVDIILPAGKIPDADLAAWADAVQKCGPSMAKLVVFADKVPQPEKSSGGKTWSMVNTRAKVAQFAYARGSENTALAALCVEYGVTEKFFNEALELAQKPPATKNIPAITIDGKRFDMAGARFHRLQADDVRGLFLGELTDCCQSIGKVGSACAAHGFASENDGFYVVEDAKGKVIAQTWAWLGKSGELVFDSLETLGGQVTPLQWQKLTQAFARSLARKSGSKVSALHIGISGYAGTPKNLQKKFRKAVTPAIPLDHESYRDSEEQIKVWKRRMVQGGMANGG